MALIHDLREAMIGDITSFNDISQGEYVSSFIEYSTNYNIEKKHIKEEITLKFLACAIRFFNSHFVDLLLNQWNKYKIDKTWTSLLVRQLNKLESID